MSRDKPIIFSAPMVRALLEGRKFMTRRLLYSKRKVRNERVPAGASFLQDFPPPRTLIGVNEYWTLSPWHKAKAGDRLWVRENFQVPEGGIISDAAGGQMDVINTEVVYAATVRRRSNLVWTPCIHMPRSLSRLTLSVIAVKVEKLQAITDNEAIVEGMSPADAAAPRGAFALLWDSLHGATPGMAWNDNPAVVALSFKVHKKNIDALKEAA